MASPSQVAAELARLGSTLRPRLTPVIGAFADRTLREVEGNARAVLGNTPEDPGYLDSFGVRPDEYRGAVGLAVGTDHPAGYRNEQGFHGTDARGATIDQPPRPHWGPAADSVFDDFADAVGEAGAPSA